MGEKAGLLIASMTVGDVDDVLAIERKSFPTPWSRFSFQTELTHNQFAIYIVGRTSVGMVAYAGGWLVLDELHITNIAVDPAHRGQRYGRSILLALLSRAKAKGAKRATLEVRTGNEAAQKLYLKEGFFFKGCRKGYYTDTGEDALIMWKDNLDDIRIAE